MMSGIRGKDTQPELIIRKTLHRAGFRYRLHDKSLPSKPDLVFPRYRAVIFVHGCFWHGHDCHLFRWPGTRQDFWEQKITRNREKDKDSSAKLAHWGWRVLTIWECAIKGKERRNPQAIAEFAGRFLRGQQTVAEIRGASYEQKAGESR